LFKRESVTDVQAAAKTMFAAIDGAQPEGIRYASCLLPDGETFVALLQVDDGVENPLPGFAEFREFLEGRRSLACRAAQRSTADGHRLVPLVLRATAQSPCADRHRAEAHGETRSRDDEGAGDESVCGRCDRSDRKAAGATSGCHGS
jgi:hypothetical protein